MDACNQQFHGHTFRERSASTYTHMRKSAGGRSISDRVEGQNQGNTAESLWFRRLGHGALLCFAAVVAVLSFSCSAANNLGTIEPKDLCNCLPVEPDIADYRHVAKHVAISNLPAIEIGVDTILGWPQDPAMPPGAPRSGRELQVFHVSHAFLQNASVNSGDCDVHFEISQIADKNAPRVVIETPVDSEYCSARRSAQSQLLQHGFRLDTQNGGELPQGLPVDVLGMAFEDFEHNRGSAQIATVWELHPATVNILP